MDNIFDRNKIVEEHYERIERICKGIASVESLYYQDLLGPAAEGLISAADAIIKNSIGIRHQKAYIDASVRNAVHDYLIQEQKQGFTGLNGNRPEVIGIQEPIGEDGNKTVENTIPDKDFERDYLDRDEVEKSIKNLTDTQRWIMKIKTDDPTATNQEIAKKTGKKLSAVKSIIYRSRMKF